MPSKKLANRPGKHLTLCRDNELVKRGVEAVHMTFQVSKRVPHLIQQSQLERNEGSSEALELKLDTSADQHQLGARIGLAYSVP